MVVSVFPECISGERRRKRSTEKGRILKKRNRREQKSRRPSSFWGRGKRSIGIGWTFLSCRISIYQCTNRPTFEVGLLYSDVSGISMQDVVEKPRNRCLPRPSSWTSVLCRNWGVSLARSGGPEPKSLKGPWSNLPSEGRDYRVCN